VKGNIVPSLLERGVQRIQEFLDNEFSGNANTDQAKVMGTVFSDYYLTGDSCHLVILQIIPNAGPIK